MLLTVVAVLAVLVLRARGASTPLQLALVGLTPWLVFPLLAASAIGARLGWAYRRTEQPRRRWRLLTAALIVPWVGYVAAVSPVEGARRCVAGSTLPAADASLTVYSHNVLFRGADPDEVAANIAALEPDAILLQESSQSFKTALAADPDSTTFGTEPMMQPDRLAASSYGVDGQSSNSSGSISWCRT